MLRPLGIPPYLCANFMALRLLTDKVRLFILVASLGSLGWPSKLVAGESFADEGTWRSDYYSLGLGVNYVSSAVKRGKVFYDGFQVVPFFSLEIFSPNLSLIGPTLYYKKRLSQYVLFRSHLNAQATREKPFYNTNGPIPEANKRDNSIEADQIVEFGLPGYGEASVMWSKDVNAHFGSYFETKLRMVLGDFPLGGLNIQPGLFARWGWGSAAHNRYLYGVGNAPASPTHLEGGFSLSAPPQIDQFFPLFELKYFKLLKDSFYESAPYHKKEGWTVYAVYAREVWSAQSRPTK